MAESTQPSGDRQRCREAHEGAGRCQLIEDHIGPHAVATDDAYLTWYREDLQRASSFLPAQSVRALDWAPGFELAAVDPAR